VRTLPKRALSLLAAATLPATAAAGCGREDNPDVVHGKELFVQKCGSCHVLARANTRGVQGPSLDAAFAAARADGLGEGTIEGVVQDQIAQTRRGSIMPEGLVTGQDAKDVAAYVALVAGVPGKDEGELAQAGKPKVSNKPIRAEGGTLRIPADPTGALAFVTTKAIAKPGSIEFVMPNESSVQHNIAVKNGSSKVGPVVGQGGTSRFTQSLRAGKYTFYCSVPGHEAGGMKGDLTVE
jgi:plastocyanin